MKNMKTYLLASAVLFASAVAFAQPAQPKGPPQQGQNQQQGPGGQQGGQRPNRPEPKEISGTVESFNKSPRGSVDAVIVTADGSKVQINLAPDLAGAVTKNIAVGDTIKAMVLPEKPPMGPQGGQGQQPKGPPPGPQDGQQQQQQGGDQKVGNNPPPPPQPRGEAATQVAERPQPPKPDHEVFHAVSVTDSKGTTYGNPEGGPPKPQTVHIESKIKSANYDRQGIANGFTVDSGELVLVPPPEGKKLGLKVGDSVKVDGNLIPNNNQGTVVVATNINGNEIQTPRPQQQQQNGPGQQQQGGMGQQGPQGGQGQQGGMGPGQPMGQQQGQGGQNQQQRPPMGPHPGGQGGQPPMGPGGGGQPRGPQGMAPMNRGAAPRG